MVMDSLPVEHVEEDDLDDFRSADKLRIKQWPPKYKNGRVGTDPGAFYKIAKAILQGMGKPFLRPKLKNDWVLRRLEERGKGFIFASNHDSGYDPIMLIGNYMGKMYILALDNPWWDLKLVRSFMEKVAVIPVAWKGNNESMRVAIRILKSDYALLVFPEGNFVHKRRKIYGRTGMAVMSATTGAPILPIGILGVDYRHFLDFMPPLTYKITINYSIPRIVKDEYRIGVNEILDPVVARGITDEIMYEIRMASNFNGLLKKHAIELLRYYRSPKFVHNTYTMADPDFS